MSYTWKKEWILNYESPWGILEKFRYANALSINNVYEILGTDNTKNKHIRSKKDRSLITLEGLDRNKIISSINIDMHHLINSYYTNNFAVDISYKHMLDYIRNTIFFCPECIKIGYHSIWFQNILINECPFHNIPLEEKCPKCSQTIPYEIDKKNNRAPLSCICGHSYFDDNNVFFISWTNHNIKIISKPLLEWLNLNCKNIEKLKLIYFDKKLAKTNNDTIRLVTSILNNNFNNKENINYTSWFGSNTGIIKNNYENIKLNNINKSNKFMLKVNNFYSEMFKSYKIIFSSVSRYIRKRLNYQNKKYINKLLRNNSLYPNPQENPINLYAYSYIMWKKSAENLLLFNPYQENNTNIKNSHTIANTLLQDLFNDWRKRFKNDILSNIVSCRWVLFKILSHIFLNHYYDWLDVSYKLAEINAFDWNLSLEKEDIPPYALEYYESEKKHLKFHWLSRNKEHSMPKIILNNGLNNLNAKLAVNKKEKIKTHFIIHQELINEFWDNKASTRHYITLLKITRNNMFNKWFIPENNDLKTRTTMEMCRFSKYLSFSRNNNSLIIYNELLKSKKEKFYPISNQFIDNDVYKTLGENLKHYLKLLQTGYKANDNYIQMRVGKQRIKNILNYDTENAVYKLIAKFQCLRLAEFRNGKLFSLHFKPHK